MSILLFICLVFIGPSLAWATGPAIEFKVSIEKFELYNGSSWVTIFDGSSATIDIAAVSAGQVAGDFLSGLSVPDGTYTEVRVTPRPTITIEGEDTAKGYYTSGANVPVSGACAYTTIAADEAPCTLTANPAPPSSTNTLSPPLVVTNGVANYIIRVDFDPSSAIQYTAGASGLTPSTVGVTSTVAMVSK